MATRSGGTRLGQVGCDSARERPLGPRDQLRKEHQEEHHREVRRQRLQHASDVSSCWGLSSAQGRFGPVETTSSSPESCRRIYVASYLPVMARLSGPESEEASDGHGSGARGDDGLLPGAHLQRLVNGGEPGAGSGMYRTVAAARLATASRRTRSRAAPVDRRLMQLSPDSVEKLAGNSVRLTYVDGNRLTGAHRDDGSTGGSQDRLFYSFNLDDRVPRDHLLRGIDQVLDLRELRAPFYSHTGRPSVDPELILRCSSLVLLRHSIRASVPRERGIPTTL